MKNMFAILIGILVITSCNNETETNADGEVIEKTDKKTGNERYGIKSGIVVSKAELPNNMGSTTTTLYFTDHGKKEYTEMESKIEMMGMSQNNKNASIIKNGYMYSWTPGETTGSKIKIDEALDLSTMDFDEMSEERKNELNLKKIGTETILGKKCDIYAVENPQMGSGKVSVWKNLVLKTQADAMGMTMKSEAISIDENAKIPKEKFEVPEDVTFSEMQFSPN